MPTQLITCPPTLDYHPLTSTNRKNAYLLLRLWQTLNALAILPLAFIGIMGTVMALVALFIRNEPNVSFWNPSSLEDWIAFLFWLGTALLLVGAPFVWTLRCGRCATALRSGDSRAPAEALFFCKRALQALTFITAGVLYVTLKAALHGRWPEIPYWTAILLLLASLLLAIYATRHLLHRCINTPSP